MASHMSLFLALLRGYLFGCTEWTLPWICLKASLSYLCCKCSGLLVQYFRVGCIFKSLRNLQHPNSWDSAQEFLLFFGVFIFSCQKRPWVIVTTFRQIIGLCKRKKKKIQGCWRTHSQTNWEQLRRYDLHTCSVTKLKSRENLDSSLLFVALGTCIMVCVHQCRGIPITYSRQTRGKSSPRVFQALSKKISLH